MGTALTLSSAGTSPLRGTNVGPLIPSPIAEVPTASPLQPSKKGSLGFPGEGLGATARDHPAGKGPLSPLMPEPTVLNPAVECCRIV